MAVQHSQLAPLPQEVPFVLVSKTIGSGAYARYELLSCSPHISSVNSHSIKKARPPDRDAPIFAVKFIHREYAMKHGKVTAKQLNLEITLHAHLGAHANIVQFFQAGADAVWTWIAMELAEGGDLFDKIESDVGVGEEVAHVYFSQLLAALQFMHGKGVGHRDLKPENVLLDGGGNLKVADFGLATLFLYAGQRKANSTSCGSPPYTAPEVLSCEGGGGGGALAKQAGPGYYADQVDVWSAGVVLFVLLVGNTPWDEPRPATSYEFGEYVRTAGFPADELWAKLPADAADLLRGMLAIEPAARLTIADIKRHPWLARPNRFLRASGVIANPVGLATTMFESMRIDFELDPLAPSSQSQSQSQTSLYSPQQGFAAAGGDEDTMDIDSSPARSRAPTSAGTRTATRIHASQPQRADEPRAPTTEIAFDWEKPALSETLSQLSQQALHAPRPQPSQRHANHAPSSSLLDDALSDEPTLSQFTPAPAVPLSRTQFARRFADILPAHSLARFYSAWDVAPLVALLASALSQLGIPMPAEPTAGLKGDGRDEIAWMRIAGRDGRGCRIKGDVVVERLGYGVQGGEGCQVSFVKTMGDPVEWRRLFKRVVLLGREAVYRGEEAGGES